jgi:hypothetical protein
MYSSIYAHAQNSLNDTEICVGHTVVFNDLITGTIDYDPDDEGTGWYVNGVKVYDKPEGFTDQPTETTMYTLRFTKDGVSYTYSLTVTVYEPPILAIPDDATICSGEDVLLYATVTNVTPYTEILWDYGGFRYNNGEWLTPRLTGGHTVTAIASNTPLCATTSKDLQITVNFNPDLAYGQSGTVPHCTEETINLNDCINFFVYDSHITNNTPPTSADSTTGTIKWYTTDSYNTLVPDPEHILLTTLNDTAFYADLSDITVCYSNTCTPSFRKKPTPLRLRVPIDVTSNHFALDYGYGTMCCGDSVYARFQLLDNNNNPSPCDTIKFLDVLSGHPVERQIRVSKTEKTLVFAPFAGLSDTIKVKVRGNLPGVEREFKLYLRKPDPPNIQSDPVCKNTDAYFSVIADHCDTIYGVQCTSITAIPELPTSPQRWRMRVPDLPQNTSFQCKVTYFSKLDNDTIFDFPIDHTLEVWTDPPKLSVFLMHNNTLTSFDHTTQLLCLGDSLLFSFYTPHDCDTIKNIEWLQRSGTITSHYKDAHTWSFFVKPAQEGDNTYKAKISYRQPKETKDLDHEISYVVKVKPRPHLFISYPDPPDTLKYCYSDVSAPLNLNPPNPSHDIIDYNFVVNGPDKVRFLNGYDTVPLFKPDKTGDYTIIANYRHLCSEMNTTLARGEVRIVVHKENEDPASFVRSPNKEGYCILKGITLYGTDREGSSLEWEHNGVPVSFPYIPETGPGTYTLTALIYNACFLPGNPKRYDVPNVRVVPVPRITVMPDITVCRGDSVVLKTLDFEGDTLIWRLTSGVSTKDTVVINNTTTFQGFAHNVCGNATDEVTVFRRPDAFVALMPDTSACLNDQIRLRVIEKEGDIKWYSSHFPFIGDEPIVEVGVSGNETYTVIAENVCGTYSASMHVTALPLPAVNVIKTDTSICYGMSLNLKELIDPLYYGILQWTPESGASITEPNMYVVTASTKNCGSDQDTLYVNVYKPLLLLPNDSQLPYYNAQDPYELSFQTLQGVPVLSYSINGTLPPGLTMINGHISGKPTLGPYDYNTHRLEVSVVDGHQCRVSKEYILAPEWKAANVLLPMGDAENAVFLPNYNLEVYNRNGLLLHKGMGWNGVWNNTYVPAGAYFYKVNILIDNVPEERMSYVVVLYY